MEASATESSILSAAPVTLASPVVKNADVHQHKRKADEANLDTSAPKPPPPTRSPTPPAALVAPSSTTQQGSCPEMAISLDSSSDEEDETDIPVDSLAAKAVSPAASACVIPAARSPTPAHATTACRGRGSGTALPPIANGATPAGCSTNGVPGARVAAAGRVPGSAASVGIPSTAVRGAGGGASSYGSQAAAAGFGHHAHTNGYIKNEAYASTGSPSMKRRAGRPMGSKSRPISEDPPYIAAKPVQVQ